jgi:BCD family chlorophyll transporter-like MFS transporter
MPIRHLSWFSIFRLGLVQLCLGAIVVLMTSTLNRLMVVELMLPAVLPGALVAFHYGVQITRPNWGYRSDTSGNRTRWIVIGMAMLAAGALLAASAIPLIEASFWTGLMVSILAYGMIGLGVGASGTSLLALMATATAERRRPAAASITWLMMILGIAATAITVGQVLDPYSHERMLAIVAVVVGAAFAVTCVAVWGIERRAGVKAAPVAEPMRFLDGLREIWAERGARNFTFFVFLSMTAYFMQELIMEPFAGLVFQMTPGQTTSMSGAQSGGVLLGMILVGVAATGLRLGALRSWVIAGCLGSAATLAALVFVATSGLRPALLPAVVTLGFFNGMFAVAAIGAMMQLAGQGRARREGTRMGLWGAAQAIAAGFGGLFGAALADITRKTLGSDATAFGTVFTIEATLFLASAFVALRVMEGRRATAHAGLVPGE